MPGLPLYCGVNDLPLTLLTLLSLGIKNIYLGPTLPAFISPNVLNLLVEQFNIKPVTTPEQDLAAIFA